MSPKSVRPQILCVDDEVGVTEALQRLLKNHFEVLTARTGAEGLEVLKLHPDCAIILSDYRMPGLNGVDFLKQSRLTHPTSVRAILSGQMDLEHLIEAINAAEIHRFIMKPWENEYLKVQMIEALQTHQGLLERQYLRELAITDPVTGLTNHRYFQETLKEQFEKVQRNGGDLSLLMVDVDHFKSYNDRYGHPEGDRLLMNIAEQLKTSVGDNGYVSRYGGEEFAILLPNMDIQSAGSIAEKLRKNLENFPFVGPHNRRAFITVSTGVANIPKHASTAQELIAAADQALYGAKRAGRNQTMLAS